MKSEFQTFGLRVENHLKSADKAVPSDYKAVPSDYTSLMRLITQKMILGLIEDLHIPNVTVFLAK